MRQHFSCAAINKMVERYRKTGSLLCVGLDSDLTKLPEQFQQEKFPQFSFNQWIIDQTAPYVLAYKPNLAFYEARGAQGWQELAMTQEYIRSHYSDILTIADAKRGDIGNTNTGYVTTFFDELQFDAVTVQPYLGQEALIPFLERQDKLIIVLVKTSNSGSGEFQDLSVQQQPLWQAVLQNIVTTWNQQGNCGAVIGATYPEDLKKARQIAPDLPLLVPGVGAQGGSLETVLEIGSGATYPSLLINSSRGIIFAPNPQVAIKNLLEEQKRLTVTNGLKTEPKV